MGKFQRGDGHPVRVRKLSEGICFENGGEEDS